MDRRPDLHIDALPTPQILTQPLLAIDRNLKLAIH